MCGIFGFSKLNDRTRAMAPLLAWAMEDRGSHSWGGTNGQECIRQLGPITESFDIPDHWDRGIFHTRFATHGARTIENAHPFDFGRVKGIHNGTLSNHSELNSMFSRDFEVDSMHLFANISEGKDFSMIQGSATIAYYIDNVLNLCRVNSNNIEVARLKTGEMVFCSTKSPITKSARLTKNEIEYFYTVKEYKNYIVDTTEDLHVLRETDKEYKFKPFVYSHGNANTNYSNNYHRAIGPGTFAELDKCIVCKWKSVSKLQLMCKECFLVYEEFITEFESTIDIKPENSIEVATSESKGLVLIPKPTPLPQLVINLRDAITRYVHA